MARQLLPIRIYRRLTEALLVLTRDVLAVTDGEKLRSGNAVRLTEHAVGHLANGLLGLCCRFLIKLRISLAVDVIYPLMLGLLGQQVRSVQLRRIQVHLRPQRELLRFLDPRGIRLRAPLLSALNHGAQDSHALYGILGGHLPQ